MSGMLQETLATGLACFALVLLVRAFVPAKYELSKPWGCNLCMSAYAAILATAPQLTAPPYGWWGIYAMLVFAGGCLGVCFLLLSTFEVLRPPPIRLPPERGDDKDDPEPIF